ncbi:isoprenylcysteine carboxylmethyltransferase family protein [Patescibacteria group bacterium]|nr:MAG: isoprenylcysteine carboxylmethyltransferase family protein [Patescibacteria group bacterium]
MFFYIVFLVFLLWALLEFRHAGMRALGQPGAKIDDRRTLPILFAVIISSIFLGFAAWLILPQEFPRGAAAIGANLMLIGMALREWSVFTLGKFFTVDVAVQAEHRVITSGPYRYIRHPAYSGVLLTMLGAGLIFGNWFGLALAFLPGSALLLWRIRVEEEVLERELDEPYRAYMLKTKRLIPFLY